MENVNKHVELLPLKVNEKITVNFAVSNIDDIIGLDASCGCTKPVLNREKSTVEVTYKAGEIPQHLKKQGFYKVQQQVIVTYKDETKRILSFSTVVTKKG